MRLNIFKRTFFLILICIFFSSILNAQDVVFIKGSVCPANPDFRNIHINRAKIEVYDSRDSIIYTAQSDTIGQFGFEFPFDNSDSVFYLYVSARNNQKRITYDSFCPYEVYKTPSGYADWYSGKYTRKEIINDTLSVRIAMIAPNICFFGREFCFQNDIQNHKPIFLDHDTMCICIVNSLRNIKLPMKSLEVRMQVSDVMDKDLIESRTNMIKSNLMKRGLDELVNKLEFQVIHHEKSSNYQNNKDNCIIVNLVIDF